MLSVVILTSSHSWLRLLKKGRSRNSAVSRFYPVGRQEMDLSLLLIKFWQRSPTESSFMNPALIVTSLSRVLTLLLPGSSV